MIKITFEVNEDFITENASMGAVLKRMAESDGKTAIRLLADHVGFKSMKNAMDQGKTEFVVTPDKLKEPEKGLWSNIISEVLLLATIETDKKEDPATEPQEPAAENEPDNSED